MLDVSIDWPGVQAFLLFEDLVPSGFRRSLGGVAMLRVTDALEITACRPTDRSPLVGKACPDPAEQSRSVAYGADAPSLEPEAQEAAYQAVLDRVAAA